MCVTVPIGGAAGRSDLHPDAPPYGVRGPHLVGARDLVIDGEAPLEISMWYPALNGEDLKARTRYPHEIKMD